MTENDEYSITINKKIYYFSCPDGEEHVNAVKTKLTKVLDTLATTETAHTLSDYAMKIAIILADELVTTERELKTNTISQQQRLSALVDHLDLATG